MKIDYLQLSRIEAFVELAYRIAEGIRNSKDKLAAEAADHLAREAVDIGEMFQEIRGMK